MEKTKHTPWKQSLRQIPVLIGLAAVLAIGANAWRSDGISLVGDWSVEARYTDAIGENLIISFEMAELLFEQDGGAVFVDARPHSQFVQGHIQGALSLPWQEVDLYFETMVDRLDIAKAIIIYCDGESCDLSHELALFLKEMGFENVGVLVNGWTLWREAGNPIEGEN